MKDLKKSADYLPFMYRVDAFKFMHSYTWQDQTESFSFKRNSEGVWVASCSKWEHVAFYETLSTLTFPTRKAAVETVASLVGNKVDLTRLYRRENLVYRIKNTPLTIGGKSGNWATSISRLSNKHSNLLDKIYAACEAEQQNLFLQKSKAQSVDFFITWIEQNYPKFFEDEAWAFKQ